jgi:hypothetical protein
LVQNQTEHNFVSMNVNNFLNSSVFRLITHKELEEEAVKTMNWIPLYIVGNEGFCVEVRKKISQSDIELMPGYTGAMADGYDLYWMDENTNIRSVKEAIGSKLVWKYRLRFMGLQDFIESQHDHNPTSLTKEELAKIEEMRSVA